MPPSYRLPILMLAAVFGPGLAATAQTTQSTPSPEQLFRQGVTAFFEARPKDSVAAFDQLLVLDPEAKPRLWQRGLALYYAGEFREGREQFEVHQTVNANDVENAAWHFICVARLDGIEAARKALIPIAGDSRIPMQQVHELYAGKATPEDVLKAAETGEGEALRNHRCFAHLYLGLFFEASSNEARAKEHIVKAATEFSMDHYMGKCAKVHARLRGWVP